MPEAEPAPGFDAVFSSSPPVHAKLTRRLCRRHAPGCDSWSMSSLRTRMTVVLSFAAGAVLYFSDHDTIDRHWRLALGLSLGAVLAVVSPWTATLSMGRPARLLLLAVLVLAGSGCASRSAPGSVQMVAALPAAAAPDHAMLTPSPLLPVASRR